MAKKKDTNAGFTPTADYRHGTSRTNIPPASLSGQGAIPKAKKAQYAYSPHLTPILRFDPSGRADRVRETVEKACAGQPLSDGDKEILRAVGEHWSEPWLEWAGKQEEHARGFLEVDPVALHIHERISAQAILRHAMRQDVERGLFGDPEHAYNDAVQFYKHDMAWARADSFRWNQSS